MTKPAPLCMRITRDRRMREIRMSGVTRGEVIGGGRPSPTLPVQKEDLTTNER